MVIDVLVRRVHTYRTLFCLTFGTVQIMISSLILTSLKTANYGDRCFSTAGVHIWNSVLSYIWYSPDHDIISNFNLIKQLHIMLIDVLLRRS